MLKSYKFRVYPNNEQREFFAKSFGCVRFVYNLMLADRIKSYEESQTSVDKTIKYPTPAQYKAKFEFLKEVDSLALSNAQLNLNKAFANFFRDKAVGFPKFKCKRDNHKTYTTNNQNGTVYIESGYIKLPKLKPLVRVKQHRQFNGLIKSVTVSQTPTGKYFVSMLVEEPEQFYPIPVNEKIGIDLGIKDFAVMSHGEHIENPKWLRKSEKRLKLLQRSLSRKEKGSKNRNKARQKVAKLHEKIANQRNDFLHKLSNKITDESQVIVIEKLSVKNMMKNHKLAKAIGEVSWSKFGVQLKYKSEWKGRTLIVAPKNYASSQLCSVCEYKNADTKKLSVREWICPNCHTHHDRDVNAAQNLLKLA